MGGVLFSRQILTLDNKFHLDYPEDLFLEPLRKDKRPHNIIVFEMKEDYFVCVPFRTKLTHGNGFHFFRNLYRMVEIQDWIIAK